MIPARLARIDPELQLIVILHERSHASKSLAFRKASTFERAGSPQCAKRCQSEPLVGGGFYPRGVLVRGAGRAVFGPSSQRWEDGLAARAAVPVPPWPTIGRIESARIGAMNRDHAGVIWALSR